MVPENSNQVAIFNPLDAEPVEFHQKLISRRDNFDVLAALFRDMLIPDKDFGRIHHANKTDCPNKWQCTYEQNPHHYSDYGLWQSGADKVLGMLGLGVTYPDESDIRRATLKGMDIRDVVMKCFVDNGRGQVISEGMGAATRNDEKGDLNKTIKKACKRARVDAVMRLPAISALFEEDFLAQIAADAANKPGGNSTTARMQKVNPRHNTGAILRVFPMGGKLRDQKFSEMEDSAIDWCLETFETQAPDIFNAAKREHDRRNSAHPAEAEEAGSQDRREGGSPAASGPPAGAMTNDYDDYPEAQE